jgi:uncharacterized protein YceH (UPF0502 family)
MEDTQSTPAEVHPQWRPLNRKERRVLGVLVEKAKTTPEQYPLSLNALTAGCNQKSNRAPKMELEQDDVEETLETLRASGAIGEVHGGGRVARYRHYMKDWLGVDGVELAVIAELLLRGSQTVGELRGRAARMATGQLPDMGSLRPVLDSLIEKKLVVPLTVEGRGQVVTHGLYLAEELEREKRTYGASGGEAMSAGAPSAAASAPSAATRSTPTAAPVAATSAMPADEDLRAEVASLRAEVARLRKEVEDLWESLGN